MRNLKKIATLPLAMTPKNDIFRINKKEVITMKKLSMLTIAVLATIMVFWSVLPAKAIIVVGGKFGMVGITMGQTARLNVVNVIDLNQISTGDRNECMVELMFFDSDGEMLAMRMVSLDPGMAAFHDLRFPADVEGRFQIRAEGMIMGDKMSCNVIPTLEIYDNETMKTEVFETITLDPY